MEDKKVSQKINNVIGDNIRKLESIFPSTVKDGEVDFEALREEFGLFSDAESGKYELNWAGKKETKKLAQEDVFGKTLRYCPDESINPASTENIYIKGDNLEVLKLLRQNYYGVVKMIYIDPPYNTGSDKVYNDRFSETELEAEEASGNIDEEGNRLAINPKSNSRYHTKWIEMIYPRLKIARDLLSDEGVIFISIDENEITNIKYICNEIYGENNCLGVIANVNNPKGRSDDKFIATAHEYILVYAKNSELADWYGFEPTDEKIVKRYNKEDENHRKYREIDLRKTGEMDLREDRPNMFYYFYYNEDTKDFYPSKDEVTPSGYVQIKPLREDGREGRWRWGWDTAVEKLDTLIPKYMPARKIWGVMEKDYLEGRSLVKATSAWTFKDVNSERGTEDFVNLGFDKRTFSNPKPVGTLYRCIELSYGKDAEGLVLDFFAGSSTTASAVFRFNNEKNSKLKFILVQYPERFEEGSEAEKSGFENICELGKERIRREGERIAKEEGGDLLDVGFKVFETAPTNIKWNSLLSSGQLDLAQIESTPDLMDFMPGSKDEDIVYELILRQRDVPLSEKLEKLTDIGERTYLYADSYLVCLESKITEEMVDKLAGLDPVPVKFIFRDSAFSDDIALKDETFRRLKAVIDKNAGDAKVSYTVEFI